MSSTDLDDLDDFSYMWTTCRDDYALIKGQDGRIRAICNSARRSRHLIEEQALKRRIIECMMGAGVRVFDSLSDWIDYCQTLPEPPEPD
jgi:hypothetical protein